MGCPESAEGRLATARRAWVRAAEAYLLNPRDPDRVWVEAAARPAYDEALRVWRVAPLVRRRAAGAGRAGESF